MNQFICFVTFVAHFVIALCAPSETSAAPFFLSIYFLGLYLVIDTLADVRRAITDLGRRL